MRSVSKRQGGFALVVVLWAGLLLALMAAGFTSAVRAKLRTTAAKVDVARAEALANAAVNIAIMDLVNAKDGAAAHRFPPNGTPVACEAGGAAAIIEVEDDEGKINLNTADHDVLATLFEGVGATPAEAERLADLIADFRDPDDDKRDRGGERDDYIKAGYAAPKNSDFVSVAELDQVMGVSRDVRERAAPFLTTAMAHAGVDPAVTSQELRKILARGSSLFVRSATTGGESSIFDQSDFPARFQSESSHQAYTVRAQVTLPEGGRYVSEAAVNLQNREAPVFRYWRRVDKLQHEQSAPAQRGAIGPC